MANNYVVNYRVNLDTAVATRELQKFQLAVRTSMPKIKKDFKKLNKALLPLVKNLGKLNKALKRTGITAARTKTKIDKVTAATQKMNATTKKSGKKGGGASTMLGAAGIPFSGALLAGGIGMALGGAIKKSAEFEDRMQSVRAILITTTKLAQSSFIPAFNEMSDVVRRVGEDTKFTAVEVAGATKFLAKAGLNIAQIKTAMPVIANLAMAGDAEIIGLADQFTNMATSFGVSMDDYRKFGDVLALVTNRSNVDITQMSESFKFASSWATKLGISGNELASAIGVLGDNALHGTLAGTGLRAMLIRMIAPTKKSQKVLDRLGMSFRTVGKDGKEKLKPLVQIFEELKEKGAGVEDLKYIFEKVGSGAALALYTGVEKMRATTEASKRAGGVAAYLGSEKMKTTVGIATRLTSKFWNVMLDGYKTMEPYIQSFLKGLISMTDWLGRNGTLVKNMAIGVAAVGAGMLAFSGAMWAANTAAAALAGTLTVTTGGWLAIGAVIGGAVTYLAQWLDGVSGVEAAMDRISAKAQGTAQAKLTNLQKLKMAAERLNATDKQRLDYAKAINKVTGQETVWLGKDGSGKNITAKDLNVGYSVASTVIKSVATINAATDEAASAQAKLELAASSEGSKILEPGAFVKGFNAFVAGGHEGGSTTSVLNKQYESSKLKELRKNTGKIMAESGARIKKQYDKINKLGLVTDTIINPTQAPLGGADDPSGGVLNQLSGAGMLKGSGNRVVIVNIDKMIGEQSNTFSDGGTQEETDSAKEKVTKVLIDAVNDFQLGIVQ